MLLPVSIRTRAHFPASLARIVLELLVREVRGEDSGARRVSVLIEGLGRPPTPLGANRLGWPLFGGWKGNGGRGF